ncbi:MAG: hypothetical protein ACE5GS_05060 [Kiloniellaceae bacterium]
MPARLTRASGIGTAAATTQAAAVWRAVALALAGFIAVKVALLFVLGVNAQYLMDEYAMARHALLIDQNPYQDVWPHKTLFYAYLYRIAFWLGGDSVEVMRFARIETLAVALASLALLYAIARNLGRSRLEAGLALCVALGFSTLMERAFMVRPEPLALLFGLGALWAVTRGAVRPSACLLAGLLSGAAFLTTQKAVYLNLALGLALVAEGLLDRSPRRALAWGALLVLGWAAMLAAYVGHFALAGAEPADVLNRVFFGPPSENAVRGHEVYENLRYFVWQTFSRNVPQYVFSLFGWLLAAATLRGRFPGERVALVFTAVVSGLVYGLHPAPWPYNFVLAIPFLALWSPLVLEPVRRGPERTRALLVAAVLAIMSLSVVRNIAYLEHDNAAQNETVRRAERLLAPGEPYFDGIHMVVTRPHATDLWLQRSELLEILAGAKRGDYSTIERVLAEGPKVWILSYRTKTIEDVLRPYLERSYVAVAPNLLLSGVALPGPGETVFETRWGGVYRLRAGDGTPSPAELFVDGRRLSGAVALEPGRHSLRLAEGAGPLYLLPADLAGPVQIPPEPNQTPLFPDAHVY